MKNKRLTRFLAALLVLGTLSACGGEGEDKKTSSHSSSTQISNSSSSTGEVNSSSSSKENDNNLSHLPVEARIFVENVNLILNGEVGLEDKDNIDGAYYVYSTLTGNHLELEEVIAAKAKLDQAREQFIQVYDEYLVLKEAEETGYAFKDAVDKVSNLDALVREDLETITFLLAKYETLSEKAKTITAVIEAKTALDAAKAKVDELIAMSDSQYAAIQFTAVVNKLPSVEDLVVEDVEKITAALSLYNALSNDALLDEKVIEAKALLDTLNTRGQELVAMKQRVDAFTEMVWSLPSFSELEWKNTTHDALIKNAENLYNGLTEDEKAFSGVSGAYEQLVAVRTYFDNMKEPYDITKMGISISFGQPLTVAGHTCYTSTFSSNHINALSTYYGIAKEDLTENVIVWLNVYAEAGAVASDPLFRFNVTEDPSGYNYYKYVEALKEEEAKGNEKVHSGMGINFTVNIESVSDLYASSKYTNFMAGQKIYWEE